MTSLWPRIEPLLAKVQKPARYIGCEDGAIEPAHSPAKVAWLLVYPDTYEIGLPNQGLQILYELLNERDDAFTVGIASEIQKVRRTGLTFAPEGGTWRMRQVISKLIREEDLYGAVESAFSQGWRRVKLYFLIGLPTETDEDVLGIATLVRNCLKIGR